MLTTCWSAKGGAGTSVVAAALALTEARRDREALIVDLGGDQPGVLGLPEPTGPGIGGWCHRAAEAPPDALVRLEVAVSERLRLLPRGDTGLPARGEALELLAAMVGADDRAVVVDAGPAEPDGEVLGVLASRSDSTLLVTRLCYLALRRASTSALRPTGVVVVEEPDRSLGVLDVEDVLGVPVVAVVPWEAAVARAVDAGLLASRLPRRLARSLRPVAS